MASTVHNCHELVVPQVRAVNAAYPGRASMAPLLDLLMTLLHWGAAGDVSPTARHPLFG